jgi:hypothetical protein
MRSIGAHTQLTKAFYQKLLDSPLVSHYFDKVNLDKLIEHQTNFIVRALGGPDGSKKCWLLGESIVTSSCLKKRQCFSGGFCFFQRDDGRQSLYSDPGH